MGKLRPCPFCGGEAERRTIYYAETPSRDAGAGLIIQCSRCTATVERMRWDVAILAWNTRANEKWSTEELKPCPFCGGPADVEGPSCAGDWFHVRCQRCNANTEGNSLARAIKAWDRRVSNNVLPQT